MVNIYALKVQKNAEKYTGRETLKRMQCANSMYIAGKLVILHLPKFTRNFLQVITA
jgi:hypothetical protein